MTTFGKISTIKAIFNIHFGDFMKIAIANDHRGYKLKKEVMSYLIDRGIEVKDYGCHSEESAHFPEYGFKVIDEIIKSDADRGILVCGSGIGMSIFANRFNGIRAALCDNPKKAEMSRLHNDSNVLCLAADFIENDEALKCVSIWLETDFLGDKYQMRNEMIEKFSRNI